MSDLIEGRTGSWEIVIGLEVHAQVTARAKLFSGAATEFGAEPNTQVSTVDAAFPGMLPVINRHCVEQAVSTGLGLDAEINLFSVFDRKNYFYPDLPAGYQISQYQQPVVGRGRLVLDMPDGSAREIGITRAPSRTGCRQEPARPAPARDLCRSEPRRHRADGDRLRARSAQRRGGRAVSAQTALDPALSRHLRRQHGGGFAALRLQRVGAASRRALRDKVRDQERELGAFCDAGDRVRGAAPDRADRGGRRGRTADAAVRQRPRRDPADALEGTRARLPLFPRSRPAAAGTRPGMGRAAARRTARTAGRQTGALCRRIRVAAGGRRRAGRRARDGRVFRKGRCGQGRA